MPDIYLQELKALPQFSGSDPDHPSVLRFSVYGIIRGNLLFRKDFMYRNILMLKFKLMQACVELLEEEKVENPMWICFSSVDGEHAPSGESFDECLEIINKSSKVTAVGINCAPPHFVQSLIQKFYKLTKKIIVVYPNSGEIWDGIAKRWLPSKCSDDDNFEVFATRWREAGAKLIGGCCQTTPSTIRGLSKVLKQGSCLPFEGFQRS